MECNTILNTILISFSSQFKFCNTRSSNNKLRIFTINYHKNLNFEYNI